MVKVRYNIDCKLEIDWAPGEFKRRIKRWQERPETKALCAKIEAESKARIAEIITAQRKR